ncbi:TIGR04283 family arsenosugar biosynthesis glycosyltransferase [Pacificispira sp.]|uniref:TIGR04283 family arsenosugar biosynthesis glycosyltransferase n=1 Tax=Pacificispira sp. TaxID=2888761 RepID=UPI003BA90409
MTNDPDDKRPVLTVVIPTLNAADGLRRLLPALKSQQVDLDVVIADGGSSDATADLASRHQARIAVAEGGRGPQIRAGIAAALSDWLVILHADSVLPPNWDTLIAAFMDDPESEFRAGYFGFALDDASPSARRLERMVDWRCRVLGLPYGDQGLVIGRNFLDAVGGYPDLPLMEDVALIRRIGKGRLRRLDARLITSAEKFRRDGYLRRTARNLLCLGLYFLGMPPRAIRWVYG